MTAEQALAQSHRFASPSGTPGNLGRTADAVWLRVPLEVPGKQAVRRVLEIDYPSLNRVDVYLVQQGRVLEHQRLGNELRMEERPLQSRAHAAPLLLAPGDYELLLRVQTQSSMVLPLALRTPEDFMAHESHAQMLQGLIAGLALCMLMYSLSHWFSLRDRLFLDYALLLAANITFTAAYFGIGAQYLRPDAPGLSMRIAPIAVLVAVWAGSHFMRGMLAVLDAFEEPFNAAGQPCSVGLTIGYALSPLDAIQADELLKRADAAMYAGKQAGRSRVQRGGRVSAAMA